MKRDGWFPLSSKTCWAIGKANTKEIRILSIMLQQLLIQHEVFLDKEVFIVLAFGHASQSSQLALATVF